MTKLTLQRNLLVMLLLSLVVAMCYWPAITDQFLLLDDSTHVVKNPYVRGGTWSGLWRFFEGPYEGLYVPLSYAVWWFTAKVSSSAGQFGAVPFHAVNLALHVVNVWLVFFIVRQVLPQSRKSAAIAALVFAVHPIQVEAVAWVSGLRDLLCSVFMLASTLSFCFLLNRTATEERPNWYSWPYLTGLVLFLFALLSKPHAVVLPVFLGVLAVSFGLAKAKKAGAFLLPWCLAVLPIIYLTWNAQNSSSLNIGAPLLARPAVAIDAIVFYLGKIFWPFGLSIDYGRSVQVFFGEHLYLKTVPVFSAIFAAGVVGYRKLPILRFLVLFACGLLPVLGFIPFFHQEISTVANRYVYFPMVAISLMTSFLLCYSVQFRKTRFLVAGLVVTGSMFLTSQNLANWQDNETFFSQTLQVNSGSQVAHAALGAKYRAEKRYEEAILHLRASLETNPRQPKVYNNLGLAHYAQGAIAAAVQMFTKAIKIDPYYPDPYVNLGRYYLDQGSPERAVRELNRALQYNPGAFEVHNNLGVAYYRLGMRDRSIAAFKTAANLNPESAEVKANLKVLAEM